MIISDYGNLNPLTKGMHNAYLLKTYFLKALLLFILAPAVYARTWEPPETGKDHRTGFMDPLQYLGETLYLIKPVLHLAVRFS